MRTVPLSRSVLAFWQDLIFLEAALLADEETRELAAPVTAHINLFMPTLQREVDTLRAVIQSNARLSVTDARLDLGIRGLFSSTLHLVNQSRKHPAFTSLFSTHIGAVVRHALKRQVEVARELIDKLALPHYTPEFRAAQTAALQPLIERGAEVLEAQRQAELARTTGRIDVRAWKEEANAVRLSVYGSLIALAAQNGRSKAWPEAFFQRKGGGTDESGSDDPVDDEETTDDV
jgi:hypothetical protein